MMKNPPHPGEHLRDDVLAPLGLGVLEASKRLGVSRINLSRLLHGHIGISPTMAWRLELAGVGTARFWVALQSQYDLAVAMQKEKPDVQRLAA